MNVEAMRCPSCGAGVAGDSVKCEFCKTRLKTMACPHCFGLMFVGSNHCGHCGEKMVGTASAEVAPTGECPRCRIILEPLMIGKTSLGECHKCSGMWMTTDEFESLCGDREEQSAVLGSRRASTASNARDIKKISYVPCPACGELMNHSNFARASGVIIDTCRDHGVWFDADELPRIIGFIRDGGLSLAREREKMELDEQRAKLREQARADRLRSRRSGPERTYTDDESGIKGFLRRLFD